MPSEDEFDPHWSLLEALVNEILTPALARISEQVDQPYIARIGVWVRDLEIPKFSITPSNRGDYDVDENVDVRIRFRRTIKPTRLRYSIQAQLADVWRRHKLSGFYIAGDIDVSEKVPRIKKRQEENRFTGGWRLF